MQTPAPDIVHTTQAGLWAMDREYPSQARVLFEQVVGDSIEHEAWNDSARTRVVLTCDIWRPELTGEERGQIKALFSAINAFTASPQPAP
ncbi:MAG: aspartyl/asparaginyl beta-hydroxylase domain-containing protein [Proteobacteria bacterium]|nr:aspartyl/asparaginyl beta-hydroxylase domain-containing protein [Pseudomonadota bacterium]